MAKAPTVHTHLRKLDGLPSLLIGYIKDYRISTIPFSFGGGITDQSAKKKGFYYDH